MTSPLAATPQQAIGAALCFFLPGFALGIAVWRPHSYRIYERAGFAAAISLSISTLAHYFAKALGLPAYAIWPALGAAFLAAVAAARKRRGSPAVWPAHRPSGASTIAIAALGAVVFVQAARTAHASFDSTSLIFSPALAGLLRTIWSGEGAKAALPLFYGFFAASALFLHAAAALELTRIRRAEWVGAALFLAQCGLFSPNPMPEQLATPAGLARALMVPCLFFLLARYLHEGRLGDAALSALSGFALALIDPVYAGLFGTFAVLMCLAKMAAKGEDAFSWRAGAPMLFLWLCLAPAIAASCSRGIAPWLALGGGHGYVYFEGPLLARLDPHSRQLLLRIFGQSPMTAGLQSSLLPTLLLVMTQLASTRKKSSDAGHWPAAKAAFYFYVGLMIVLLAVGPVHLGFEYAVTLVDGMPLLILLGGAIAVWTARISADDGEPRATFWTMAVSLAAGLILYY